jgi:putative transposase
MHCLWTLPHNDTDYPARWRAIKGAFSKQVPVAEPRSASRADRNERGIWQRRYWEHTIRDDRDYATHADYIHFNPVKHLLVETPSQWEFSSFHRWVSRGWYPPAWDGRDITLSAGERDDENQIDA